MFTIRNIINYSPIIHGVNNLSNVPYKWGWGRFVFMNMTVLNKKFRVVYKVVKDSIGSSVRISKQTLFGVCICINANKCKNFIQGEPYLPGEFALVKPM